MDVVDNIESIQVPASADLKFSKQIEGSENVISKVIANNLWVFLLLF